MTKVLKIQILIDNPGSWMNQKADSLVNKISNLGHQVTVVHKEEDVSKGDILFLLSCEKKFTSMHLNKYTLVIHDSELPKGKGWSPLTWQILEGKDEVTATLFQAVEKIDAGPIYLQKKLKFSGTELIEEIREMQSQIQEELALEFIDKHESLNAIPQSGEETFYPRRKPKDSELDISKSIKEQFNLLRVVDNERYPAYFFYKGKKYVLKISAANE
jgi:methionyl-tRNA formyltransferase